MRLSAAALQTRGLSSLEMGFSVRKNQRPKLTRFLSLDEIERLHATIDACVADRPSRGPKADVIRLLLYTGNRRGEIQALKWHEVDDASLNLSDSKTGPRRVYLNQAARTIIGRQPRTESAWVFPSPTDPSRHISGVLEFWYKVRRRTGIDDVRCHDIRHFCVSLPYRLAA